MPAGSTARDHRLDVAKGILISLVVLGHVLEAVSSWAAPAIRLPLTLIYMFHMPAFVFLAGITAKTSDLARRLGTLAVLLIIFQALYYVVVQLLGADRTFSVVKPFWILWFLLAMILWNAVLPFVRRAPKLAVPVSLAVGLACGALDFIGYEFSLSRALVFLPFFVIGAAYGKALLDYVGRLSFSAKAASATVSGAAGIALFILELRRGWLYGSFNFDDLKVGSDEGAMIRAGLFVLALAATLALLSFVRNRAGWLASLGRHSLAVYLLHGFVVLAVTPFMPQVLEEFGSLAALATSIVLSALIVLVLSHPAFDRSIRAVSAAVVNAISLPIRRKQELPFQASSSQRS